MAITPFAEVDSSGAKIQFTSRENLAPQASVDVAQLALAASTAQRVAVPAGAKYVVYSFDGDFWALEGGSGVTAVIGAAATTGGNAEFNPTQRKLLSGTTHISVIADATRKGSLAFYG